MCLPVTVIRIALNERKVKTLTEKSVSRRVSFGYQEALFPLYNVSSTINLIAERTAADH